MNKVQTNDHMLMAWKTKINRNKQDVITFGSNGLMDNVFESMTETTAIWLNGSFNPLASTIMWSSIPAHIHFPKLTQSVIKISQNFSNSNRKKERKIQPPGDALPVRSLLSSPNNAVIAASIWVVALALMVGPISGKTSTVLSESSSSTIPTTNPAQKINQILKPKSQNLIFKQKREN